MAMSLFLVSSGYAMELPIEYEKNNQKSFKAQLMAGKIDECFKYVEGEKEKNRHYCTLASEALTCINRPESLLNMLQRIEDLLSRGPASWRLIHLAARYNDLKLLKYLKENHTVIDFKDSTDTTPLFYAAYGNATEAMKLLKKWGTDINARNSFGQSALHFAAIANAFEAMKLLHHWGLNIDSRTYQLRTLFHLAAQANAIEAMNLLKDWGADINANDRAIETPLHYAARANAIEAMNLLKDWGANVNAKNVREHMPLHCAARANAIEAMNLLKDWGADINAKDLFDETPLHCAARANAIEAMKLLKDWGADINAKNLREDMPVHCAVRANAIEAMKLLKDWGADINARSYCGMPMHYAAEGNAIEAMQLLKEWGANVNAKKLWEDMPVHWAARANAIEAMKLLKDWGADINARSYCGMPMHYAAEGNAIEAMRLLKEWGADIEEKEKNGATALALAIKNGKNESMDFLCFLGANRDIVNESYANEAAQNGLRCFEFIRKINHIDPSQSLDDKETFKLLFEAVEKGLFCSVRRLLSLGKIKDINQKNDAGYTILHYAAIHDKVNIVKILLTTPEVDAYSRTYGTVENCPACKAQTPYDKILKTRPRKGCQTCGSLTAYDLASPEIKEIYHEMRERIAIIAGLKKLPLPKELAYILFRHSNYLAKHTFLPKGLFHKALKIEEEKQKSGEEQRLKLEAEKAAELVRQQKEAEDKAKAEIAEQERKRKEAAEEQRRKLEAEKNDKKKKVIEIAFKTALYSNTVNDQTIKELQENSLLNMQDATFNRTPAMMAADFENLELLKRLVSLGADLLVQDSCGDNALHIAVLHNRSDIAQYIMQREPRTAIAKNKDGLNPIDLAIKLKKSKELLQALYEETKKVTMSNKNKKHHS